MASWRRIPGDFDGSYEIDVITAIDEITRVMVKDSDTISQIEHKIYGKIKSRSPTHISIFIKNLKGRIMYYLEIKPSDTIGDVKAKMSDFAHILVFNGVALEDHGTLADVNITDGSILTRIDMVPQAKMEIFVHTFTKKTISLSVTPAETIANVKLWIMHKERVPVDEQVLIFNGMALGDSGTLSHLDIHGQSALTLVRRSRGLIKIFVKTLFQGKVIHVKVHPSNTIGDVKSKIEGEVAIPHDEQKLTFNETVLDNMDTVANCNINEESTLTLARIPTNNTRIFIETQAGTTVPMIVEPSDTVYNVKRKFENTEGIPRGDVRFFFSGRQLGDSATLANCGIFNKSMINSFVAID